MNKITLSYLNSSARLFLLLPYDFLIPTKNTPHSSLFTKCLSKYANTIANHEHIRIWQSCSCAEPPKRTCSDVVSFMLAVTIWSKTSLKRKTAADHIQQFKELLCFTTSVLDDILKWDALVKYAFISYCQFLFEFFVQYFSFLNQIG